MNEYEIQVTTVTTVYIEAENDAEAVAQAHMEALHTAPDSSNAVILGVCKSED